MTARRPDQPCEWCGVMFHPYFKTGRFCSISCAEAKRHEALRLSRRAVCVVCGAGFVKQQFTRTCSRECGNKLTFKGGPAASRRRRRYGMEPAEYDRLAEKGCALCGLVPEGYPLYVDHDHDTKENRGLLCARCNSWVGAFDALSATEVFDFWEYANPGTPLEREMVEGAARLRLEGRHWRDLGTAYQEMVQDGLIPPSP